MTETIVMGILATLLWVLLRAPAILGICFNYNPKTYKESVLGGLWFTVSLVVILLICLAVALVVTWLGGDPTPISTLIDKLKGM